MINFSQTVISQYTNSQILSQLIANFNEYVDPASDIDNFYNLIWNIDTAKGYGLDVWGRILGVNRVLQVSNTTYFGFAQATTTSAAPFDQGPFYSGQRVTQNYALSDAGFLVLLFAKALANISDCSAQSINQILLNLFPKRGNCYVTDGLNMTMVYNFNFLLTPVEAAIVQQSGALPRPVGVSSTVIQTPPKFSTPIIVDVATPIDPITDTGTGATVTDPKV